MGGVVKAATFGYASTCATRPLLYDVSSSCDMNRYDSRTGYWPYGPYADAFLLRVCMVKL